MRVSKGAVFCLLANAVGLSGYLFYFSKLWADMPDGKLYADDGATAISWFLTAFPFMAVCAVVNLIALIGAIRNVFLDKGWALMAVWLIVVGAWKLMDLYANSHFIG